MKRSAIFVLMFMVVSLFMLPGFVLAKGVTTKLTLTQENPIKVDEKAKTVTFLASVNGKYFFQPTRHAAIFTGGKYDDKSVFRSYASPKDFYEGLIKIGLKAGDNMTAENKETTFVQGDLLEVTVTWAGAKKAYKLDEVIKDSNGKPIVIRFGGNSKAATEKNTGCLICLDSCPVGITSNASYTFGAVEKRGEVKFTGKQDVLPPDGTLVEITVKKAKI